MTTSTIHTSHTSLTSQAAPLDSTDAPTGVSGTPRVILRVEGAALLVVATLAYAHLGAAGWGLFAALFFVPDVAFFGYLAGPRVGAAAYNLTHSTLGPAILGLLGAWVANPLLLAIALVWVGHVGFDRMFGYGLKHASAFGHTHLGVIRVPGA
jgi:hypothetical protein